MAFSDFDQILDAARSESGPGESWSEVRRRQAAAELVRFNAEDWIRLEHQWRARPAGWKRLFAGLHHPSSGYAQLLPVLVEMILSPDRVLALEAALALERLVDKLRILRPHPMDYSAALPGRLEELMGESGAPAKLLERLKRRLLHSYSF